MKQKKKIIILGLIIVISLIFTIYRMLDLKSIVVSDKIGGQYNKKYILEDDTQCLETTLKLKDLKLKSIQLTIVKNDNLYTEEMLYIVIKNARTKEVLCKNEILIADQKSVSYGYKAIVPVTIDNIGNDKITIEIRGKNIINSFGIQMDSTNIKNDVYTKINNKLVDMNPVMSIIYNDYKANMIRPIIEFLIIIMISLTIFIICKRDSKQHFLEKKKKSKITLRQVIFHIILNILISFIFVLFMYSVYKIRIENIVEIYEEKETLCKETSDYITTNNKETLTQVVVCDDNWFKGLSISKDEVYGISEKTEINYIIADDNNKIIYNGYLNCLDFKDKSEYELILDKPIHKSNNKKFYVKIKILNGENNIRFNTSLSTTQFYLVQQKQISNRTLNINICYENNHFIINLYILLCILILILIYGLYYLVVVKNNPLYRIYLFFGFIIGTIFCGLITIYAVPDETRHLDTVYKYSNQLLGIKDSDTEGYIYKRKEDVDKDVDLQTDVNVDSYRKLYYGVIKKTEDTSLVEAPATDTSANANILFYLPASVGMSIGRLLKLNMMQVFILGRLFNMIFCISCIGIAIAIIPTGKYVLFTLGMMPMIFQEASSFSYDAIIVGVSFVFTAAFYNLLCNEEYQNNKTIILLIISGMLLGSCKGGVFLPLIGALMIFPFRKYKNKKNIYIIIASAFSVTILMFMLNNAETITNMLSRTVAVGGASGQELYTLSYLKKHIIKFPLIIADTLLTNSDNYITGIIGGELAWFTIKLPKYIIACFITMFAVSYSYKHIKKKYKYPVIWICSMCLASLILVMTSMLLAWTPVESKVILGVQGRYFIPILPMLLCCFVNKKENYSKRNKLIYIFLYIIIYIMMIIEFLSLVLCINK